MHRVLIVMGSESDLPTMQAAVDVLADFGVGSQVRISSAHRAIDATLALARSARDDGFSVVIAGAGLAAHLPGVIAACTTLPVIGVPIASGALNGADALHAIVQMPTGVPVATVAINGAANAGLLAVQILAVADVQLAHQLAEHRTAMAARVQAADARATAMPTSTTAGSPE